MIPRLQTFRDGPAMWHDWAMAALLEDRTVLLDAPLNEDVALRVSAELMLLDGSGDDPVRLRVSSAGGTLDGALMLVDVIDLLGVPVHATCTGRAEGGAVFAFSVCDERVLVPHARLRIEEPEAAYCGSGRDLTVAAEHHRTRVDQLVERVAAAIGRTPGDLRALLDARAFLTADEALASGFADDVARPDAEIRRFPRRVGYEPR